MLMKFSDTSCQQSKVNALFVSNIYNDTTYCPTVLIDTASMFLCRTYIHLVCFNAHSVLERTGTCVAAWNIRNYFTGSFSSLSVILSQKQFVFVFLL